MKHGFVAWTPLHIINMLNVQKNFIKNDDEIVFFILDNFTNSSKLISDLKMYFPHIEVVIIHPKNYGSRIEKISRLYFNKNPFYNDTLDEIYIPGDIYFGRILFANQYSKNKNLKLNYIEDGLGAYVGVDVVHRRNLNDKVQELINKKSIYHAEWENAFVYEPTLLPKKLANYTKKIPKLDKNNKVYKNIYKLFESTYDEMGTNIKKQSILFFDQPFNDGQTKIDETKVFNDLKTVADELKLDIQIKLHPRSNEWKYGKDVDYLETNMPWEVYLLFNDIEDFILVGINTTAAFSPFLLFNEKIPVILLSEYVSNYYTDHTDSFTHYKISESVQLSKRMKIIFKNLLKIPTNKKELINILSEI